MSKNIKVFSVEDLMAVENKLQNSATENELQENKKVKQKSGESVFNIIYNALFGDKSWFKSFFNNFNQDEMKVFKQTIIAFLIILNIFVVFFIVYPTVLKATYHNKVKGKLEYEGLLRTYDISNKDYSEVIEIVDNDYREFQNRSVVLKMPQSNREYNVDASLLGIEYKKAQVIEEIKRYNSDLDNWNYFWKTQLEKGKVSMVLGINTAKTKLYLQHIYDEIRLDSKNASVRIDGVNIIVEPAVLGQKIDIDGSVNTIKNNLSTILLKPLILETEIVELPPLTTEMAENTKNKLSKFYNYPIIIKGDNSSIEEQIDVKDILSSIKIVANEDSKRFDILFTNLTPLTKTLVENTKQNGEIPKISLLNGIYQITDEGKPDIILDQEDLDKKLSLKFKQIIDGDVLGQSYNPYIFVKTNIKEYNVGTVKWSEFKSIDIKTSYDLGQYLNIQKAIPNLNLIVFNPGQRTSLLNIVGNTTYQTATDIDGNQKQGGGLSILGTGIIRVCEGNGGMISNYKKLAGVNKYVQLTPAGSYAEFIPNKADIELLSGEKDYFKFSTDIKKEFKNNSPVNGNNLPLSGVTTVQVEEEIDDELVQVDKEITVYTVNSLKAIQQSGIGDIKLEWSYTCGKDAFDNDIDCDGNISTKVIAKNSFGEEKVFNTYDKNLLIPSEFNDIWTFDVEFSYNLDGKNVISKTKVENVKTHEQWQIVTVKLFKFSPFEN